MKIKIKNKNLKLWGSRKEICQELCEQDHYPQMLGPAMFGDYRPHWMMLVLILRVSIGGQYQTSDSHLIKLATKEKTYDKLLK